ALYKKSNKILERVNKISNGKLQIIGLGGVESGETAYQKIKLGATAIQLYSGLVFKGPDLIENILSGLFNKLKKSKK
ncbi:dihydroorotate dehydrogenase (quinone), partial [Alphaproteobacteria bacterium]|nr:dihydroorotate dehydrogenase (quinone) [Alphaproteobacteria bacterium]